MFGWEYLMRHFYRNSRVKPAGGDGSEVETADGGSTAALVTPDEKSGRWIAGDRVGRATLVSRCVDGQAVKPQAG